MFILNQQNSIANQFIAELRNVEVQNDRMRFRRNMERIGELLAYELSKTLEYSDQQVQTPLAKVEVQLPASKPILISILRAGIPLHQGVLNYFDLSDNGFIGAYRKHDTSDIEFSIAMEYLSAPDIENKEIIIIDPMLATGKSLVKAYDAIVQQGTPKHVHFVSAIAAPQGVEYVKKNIKEKYSFWIGALDEGLNDRYYIVPGLGDAGDLSFGMKL